MTKIAIQWNPDKLNDSEGIIVGTDKKQENLLPWWWMNFRLHNNYPVTFVNFGDMSSTALEWCQRRGTVVTLTLPDDFIFGKEKIDPLKGAHWEKGKHDFWHARIIWFKKPFALLLSPYEKTLWLDLDCQVRGSLEPLFRTYLEQGEVALVPENAFNQKSNQDKGLLLPGEIMYNAGVIAYKYQSKIIEEWCENILENNHLFLGDQHLLVRMIFEKKLPIVDIPILYNWSPEGGIDRQAIIIHWWAGYKRRILAQIEELQTNFFIDLSLNN